MDRATRPEGNIADIQHGWDVYGSDEAKVGNVSEVQNNYIVAHKGFFFPKDLYIPFAAIARIEHDRVYLNVVKDAVDGQGWDAYPDEGGRTVRAVGMTETGVGTSGRGERRTEAPTGDTLHLHEEQLQTTTQRQQSGEVRVGKEVVEEQRTVNVPVMREEVYVERIPADGRPASHNMDESAVETIRVPVSEETVHVEKVPVQTEEVRVGKREVQETRQVTDTVRREQARVEHDGNVRVEDDTTSEADRGKL